MGLGVDTYNNPGENGANVSVVPVQPLPGILVFKSDAGSFKSRFLWRSWCQGWELVRKIYRESTQRSTSITSKLLKIVKFRDCYLLWWQHPSVVLHPPRYILLLHPILSSCQVVGRRLQLQGRQRSGTAAALSGGPPQSLWAEDAAASLWGTQEMNEQLSIIQWLVFFFFASQFITNPETWEFCGYAYDWAIFTLNNSIARNQITR